jgi:hypothetical protein
LVFGQWGHDVVQLNWGRSPVGLILLVEVIA